MNKIPPKPIRISVPFTRGKTVGLGDAVKRATSSVGIKPCGGCQRRAEALNRKIVFGPRK
jgi:hypothetical protein